MGALVFVVLVLCAGIGAVLGQPKGLLGLGMGLGFLLGPIGVVVVLLMKDAPHVARAKQAPPGQPVANVEEQFRSLDDLVARGIITSAERDAARASLLAAPMAPVTASPPKTEAPAAPARWWLAAVLVAVVADLAALAAALSR